MFFHTTYKHIHIYAPFHDHVRRTNLYCFTSPKTHICAHTHTWLICVSCRCVPMNGNDWVWEWVWTRVCVSLVAKQHTVHSVWIVIRLQQDGCAQQKFTDSCQPHGGCIYFDFSGICFAVLAGVRWQIAASKVPESRWVNCVNWFPCNIQRTETLNFSMPTTKGGVSSSSSLVAYLTLCVRMMKVVPTTMFWLIVLRVNAIHKSVQNFRKIICSIGIWFDLAELRILAKHDAWKQFSWRRRRRRHRFGTISKSAFGFWCTSFILFFVGLWTVCLNNFTDIHRFYDYRFTGCMWVFEEEYYIIHDYLLPGFYIAVQFFFTLTFTLLLVSALLTIGVFGFSRDDDRYMVVLLSNGAAQVAGGKQWHGVRINSIKNHR